MTLVIVGVVAVVALALVVAAAAGAYMLGIITGAGVTLAAVRWWPGTHHPEQGRQAPVERPTPDDINDAPA